MNASIHKCDNCGKSVEDRYAEYGWLHLSGQFSMAIKRPKKNPSSPISVYLSGSDFDFCNMKCLANYIAQQERIERDRMV